MPKADVVSTQKIVVGVNGSAASDAALEWATQEAESRGAEIIAVHVLKPIGPLAARQCGRFACGSSTIWATMCDSCLRRSCLGPDQHGRQASDHRVEGRPATEILHVADTEDADLIVVAMGTQHNGGFFLGCCPRVEPQSTASLCVDSFAMHVGASRPWDGISEPRHAEADLVRIGPAIIVRSRGAARTDW